MDFKKSFHSLMYGMLRLKISILLITIFSFQSYSQSLYKVTRYELCNLNPLGVEVNCKEFSGSNMIEYLKIDPHFDIELKFINEEATYKTRWDDSKIMKFDNGIYTYKIIENNDSEKKTYLLVLLLFEDSTDRLSSVFYSFVMDGIPITCKLRFED